MSPLVYKKPGNPWFSWAFLHDNASSIRDALVEHVQLTVGSVAIAALIAIPLAVLAYWVRPLAAPILTSSGVLYTVPSLALFALLAPFLGVGSRTVVIGLVLYALLVLVRNTLTGLLQVPAEVREAATAMGYGRLSRLLRVELPLALPGVLTGLRLATVSTVALVTVGVVVGRGGLGGLMIAGFRNNYYKAQIATSGLLCVLLASLFDGALLLLGLAIMPWSRRSGR